MYLFVALGGALGSGLRYFLSNKINCGGDFPLATLIINVVGAFFLAIIAFYAEKNKLDPRLILFLKVHQVFPNFFKISMESKVIHSS